MMKPWLAQQQIGVQLPARKLWRAWFGLVVITLLLALFSSQANSLSWVLLATTFSVIKLLIITEHYMGLSNSFWVWRLPMLVYAIILPLLCVLIMRV